MAILSRPVKRKSRGLVEISLLQRTTLCSGLENQVPLCPQKNLPAKHQQGRGAKLLQLLLLLLRHQRRLKHISHLQWIPLLLPQLLALGPWLQLLRALGSPWSIASRSLKYRMAMWMRQRKPLCSGLDLLLEEERHNNKRQHHQ
jgi:hypothetical protein